MDHYFFPLILPPPLGQRLSNLERFSCLGIAVVSTAVFGVPPETLAVADCSSNDFGKINIWLADETSARAVETTALPNPSESFGLRHALQKTPVLIWVHLRLFLSANAPNPVFESR